MALQEAACGHLAVHSGELYGRRPHVLPLLPPAAAAALWALQAAAGAALAFGARRPLAARVAAAAVLVGLTQTYFNQKMFLFLTLAALSLRAPGAGDAGPGRDPGPGVAAARAQLLLLYAASAAFKLRDGFWDGSSLRATLEQLAQRGLSGAVPSELLLGLLAAVPWAAALLSSAALAAEAALPALLPARPRTGAALVFLLHAAFALCLPGLWPFSLACAAGALLFVPPAR